jgi:amino acid adenylation domain-containing protein
VAVISKLQRDTGDRAPTRSWLPAGFLAAAERFSDRPALVCDDRTLSYRELRARARSLAATISAKTPAGGSSLTAVFAYRTPTAYAGVLGALLAGTGYVPLNRRFPSERTRVMLERADCRALIVDSESARQLPAVIGSIEHQLLIVLPDTEDVTELAAQWPRHTVLGRDDLVDGTDFSPISASGDDIAYLLFTSGSTGIPKGVMVAHRNVRHFVDVMVERYDITEDDRFSQTFDMTFDLSVFDMFVAWERGACVCVLPVQNLMKPSRWIVEQALTVWFSVPSLALLMKRLGMLKPARYPSLRWSLFCGEALPAEVADAWASAAPSSIVENLYGPTELTIACTLYRWDPESSPGECTAGLVPIGEPYPGMTTLVADAELREVGPGGEGELLLAGPQVTLGYWLDPEKTAQAFVVPPGETETYYRTGDLVRRPAAAGPLAYVGRVDHQVKINGYRVELGEIVATIRSTAQVDEVVALGWPRTASGAAAVTAFVVARSIDAEAVRAAVASRLPDYMVPRTIHAVPDMPLNANGKFDRKALLEMLDRGEV